MNLFDRICIAFATADRVEVNVGGDVFVAKVNFIDEKIDDLSADMPECHISLLDTDNYFPPVNLYSNELSAARIYLNKIIVENKAVIELLKLSPLDV